MTVTKECNHGNGIRSTATFLKAHDVLRGNKHTIAQTHKHRHTSASHVMKKTPQPLRLILAMGRVLSTVVSISLDQVSIDES